MIKAYYSTIIFDCDGVVLNSNKIKTKAFYDVALKYGHQPAQSFKDYHVQNGGISRYLKFEYFLTKILNKKLLTTELDNLLSQFSREVKKAMLNCEVSVYIDELRKHTKDSKWMIISGGDQDELRDIFTLRNLEKYFDGGIFGSPDTKDTIFAREVENKNINKPGLYIGDSKYDYEAAKQAGLDFVFITQWTEVSDWHKWSIEKGVICRHSLSGLID